MSNPLGITAAMLNKLKGSEINHHIEEINRALGKKVLTKQGNNDERRKRVAAHFGIDLALTAPVLPGIGPALIDEKVGKEQWVWARKLAQEWADTEAAGLSFKLWPSNAGELIGLHF
jgi:hypothetical protein